MSPSLYFVVSADNTPYIAWQAKLFHFSCVTRAGAVPLVFVHGAAQRELLPAYDEIARTGGVVCRVPSFRSRPDGEPYAPRNTPGTLLSAAELCEEPDAAFVLCDADMIFTRRPNFLPRLSADRYDYLDYSEPRVVAVAHRLGIRPERLQSAAGSLQSGVPHVVPAAIARPFAETWLDIIDAFEGRGYVDSMYAFGLAAAALELEVLCTQHMITNFDHDRPASDAEMIHYGYGDARWDKRSFVAPEQIAAVWHPQDDSPEHTVLGAIVQQLRQAGVWYAERQGRSVALPSLEDQR